MQLIWEVGLAKYCYFQSVIKKGKEHSGVNLTSKASSYNKLSFFKGLKNTNMNFYFFFFLLKIHLIWQSSFTQQ